ncbi:response regulator, partial [Escherichia coli]|nr:response regulator [Escherichia coli]
MDQASEKRRRILIADDEAEISSVLSDLLSAAHDCETVGSAEEALARLHTHDFDLVISDIMMHGMSGLELVPRVLALAPDTVV